MATAVTPVPQESVSFSTPLSYVRTLNLESEIISTKFTLTPSFLNTELFLISLFFSCAFVVREWDHVKFDIIYLAVSRRTRTIFAIMSATAIVAGMLYALLPTLDYIDWMKIRKTSTVRNPFTGGKIPMRTIFSVYGAFMVVVAARYAWLVVDTFRNGSPKTELEIVLEA